jgi:ketosteroid isomerase-like protein/nitrite reductase/ring-hydroxylating ferredoxin subunit
MCEPASPGIALTCRRIAVAKLADLPPESNRAIKIDGRSVLLCRTSAGVFAVENRCTHQLAALEGGRMRGVHLFCPKHGARFDMRTGATVGTLAKAPIQTFAAEVDADDNILIEWPVTPPDAGRAIQTSEEQSMKVEESNKQAVKQFLELFSSGAVTETMAMMTEDATWWVAGTMPISGTYDKAQFTRLLSGVLETCTGPIRITPKAFTAEGDRVALEAESYTQTRSGRTYNNLYHFVFRVREGKIAGVKEYLDTMHANAVLCTP